MKQYGKYERPQVNFVNNKEAHSLLKDSMFCYCVRFKYKDIKVVYPPPTGYVLWAYEHCESCNGSGIPPIPCSELRNFYPEGFKDRSGKAFNSYMVSDLGWKIVAGK